MSALTQERNTAKRTGVLLTLGSAAAVVHYAGALAARDVNGNSTPGAVATTLRGVGRVKETVDNSTGVAGDEFVDIEKGIFRFANSVAADEITRADIGNDCYIVDDQTVAKTDGSGTRSIAGKIHDVDSVGVWIDFR